MNKSLIAMAVAIALPLALPEISLAQSSTASDTGAPVKSLVAVTVAGGQPTSLPTQIPTNIMGATREQIDQTTNATDSEDALKYFPSLLIRKRYIGDYNLAVLSSRESNTGNSARSAVYADGILLLRSDVIQTQSPDLCEVEFGLSSLNSSGGVHACQ